MVFKKTKKRGSENKPPNLLNPFVEQWTRGTSESRDQNTHTKSAVHGEPPVPQRAQSRCRGAYLGQTKAFPLLLEAYSCSLHSHLFRNVDPNPNPTHRAFMVRLMDWPLPLLLVEPEWRRRRGREQWRGRGWHDAFWSAERVFGGREGRGGCGYWVQSSRPTQAVWPRF